MNRREARKYAVGVPNARMSTCATSVVLSVTISASVTIGFESCRSSSPGGTWTKIATIGSAMNANVTAIAAKYADREQRPTEPRPLELPRRGCRRRGRLRQG